MPLFRYTAISPTGTMDHGEMEAKDEEGVIRTLQRAGSIPVKAEPATRGGLRSLFTLELGRGQSLSRTELTNATRELSIMLGAGQDIDRAMRFLVETAPNVRVGTVLQRVRDALRDGKPLATALGQQPRSFPRLYVGLVRAGEAGGNLAATLERMATLLERERSLASTVKSAMIYPALLLVAAIGSVVLLLTSVLPKFVPLFEQNGASLPPSTQMLIDVGDAVTNYGIWMLLLLIVAGVATWQALQRPGPRLMADRLLLRLPILGSLAREVVAARFTRTLGTLLTNGVPLIAALGIVAETVGNTAATAAIEAASRSAKGGAGLSAPMAEARVMPLRTIYLLRLGEETAQLGPMALRAAEIHEEKTRLGVGRLVALLVPVITIVMGAVVAAIVSSLLMAMLSLNDLASG